MKKERIFCDKCGKELQKKEERRVFHCYYGKCSKDIFEEDGAKPHREKAMDICNSCIQKVYKFLKQK